MSGEPNYLQLQARFDQLQRYAEQLQHERDDARHALDESQRRESVLQAQLHELQGDHQALREQHQQLIDLVSNKQDTIRRILQRLFGPSRERFVPGQEMIAEVAASLAEAGQKAGLTADAAAIAQFPEQTETETDSADAPVPKPPTKEKKAQKRPPGSGGRKALPADLPRREESYTPPVDHPDLEGAEDVRLIGRALIERLDIEPLQWVVQALSCPIMAITKHGCTMQVTVKPPAIIDRGQVTDRALIQMLVDKHGDHLPYYRQQQRAARHNLTLPRNKLCRWQQCVARFVESVYDAHLENMFSEGCLGIDDSVMRRWDLGRGTGRCAQGRLWAVSGHSGWYYMATETREAQWITDLLEPYAGAIMGDACASHNQLLARSNILALFCWAHVRRKFYESAASPFRDEMLTLIYHLYDIESAIREGPAEGVVFHRRRHAQPVLNVIKERLDEWMEHPDILPGSDLGKAVRYAHKRWDGLIAWVDLPDAPIDNNDCERGMRSHALNRKNSLFHASAVGARSYAIMQTLIQSAIKLGLNPEAYLNGIVQALHAGESPEDLVPIRWKAREAELESVKCS